MLNNTDIQGTVPIGALVKTSLVDYPKKVSSALFLHGCNLRCPYCYNKDLVTGTFKDFEAVSFNDVMAHLQKRKNVISGFVISGGEPCISPFLEPLIEQAHELGYSVKLDTNGTFPEKLASLMKSETCRPDFIAMDVKTSLDRYNLVGCNNTDNIKESIKIISSFPTEKREFRTVLVPPLVDKDNIKEIASLLPKDASWQFANFKNINCLDESYNNIEPYTPSQAKELVNLAKTIIEGANLR